MYYFCDANVQKIKINSIMKKTIINCVLGICAAGLLFVCYKSIHDTEAFDAEIAAREAVVKAHLMEIRQAEEAYKAQHEGMYCASWDELTEFVRNGKLPIIKKQGVLSDAQMEKGLTEAVAAAIVNSGDAAKIAEYGLQHFRRDTVWVSLRDSLYTRENFCIDSLRYIPFAEGDTFELAASASVTRSGTILQVMECCAPDSCFLKNMGRMGERQINNRAEDADKRGAYAGLKIGDLTGNWNNNAGNWE